MPLDRPIPAFYCCYLLRSTIRHGNVYVGSTPNPVRRLRQHNGEAKGGAARTNRPSLRPWEMTCIVTGFPSHIAALQFEWAWQNPHITLHIPPSSRIQHSTAKKRSGHPKRPRHSVASLLSNLHLLLRVPSFSRWPLQLHFFSEDVHKAWLRWTTSQPESIRASIPILTDFPPEQPVESLGLDLDPSKTLSGEEGRRVHGIAVLDINYAVNKAHVEKGKGITDFEREGACSICQFDLEHEAGIYAICPNPDCEAVTHLKCLSTHFLSSESTDDADTLVPIKGTCPSCKIEHTWVDIVKEVTLRMRGQKEVEKLLKKKRVPKGKGKTTITQAVADSESEDDDDDMDLDEEEEVRNDFVITPGKEGGDVWHELDDSDSDTGSITSNASASLVKPISQSQSKGKSTSTSTSRPKKMVKIVKQLPIVIEDSDWDDAHELD